jgi:hypothetical protein
LVWLLNLLAHEPDSLKDGLDLIMWGRGEELQAFSNQAM